MKTFTYEMVGRVVVWVGTAVAPAQAEWDAYLAAVRTHVKLFPLPLSFVYTQGAGPTAMQRKQLTATIPTKTRVAVITRSAMERGIVTALSWFVPEFKSFAPGEEVASFDHLGLTAHERASVSACVARLRGQLEQVNAQRPTG
jgi:hypothetical protein